MPKPWQRAHMLFAGGGRRLEKLPKLVKETAPIHHHAGGPYIPSPTNGLVRVDAYQIWGLYSNADDWSQGGNLTVEAYRSFSGHRCNKSDFSQCRVCLSILRSKASRRDHGKGGCNLLLACALEELTKEGMCLVCKTKTTQRRWGVVLCSEACMDLWKFDVVQPLVLREALLDAEEVCDVAVLEENY